MTACPGSDTKLHTCQTAQTISRVRNGMMKTYFVLWDSKLQFGGAGEKEREVVKRFWCVGAQAMSMNCEWASVWAEHLHNNLAGREVQLRETERDALVVLKTSCHLVHIKAWELLCMITVYALRLFINYWMLLWVPSSKDTGVFETSDIMFFFGFTDV